MAEGAEGIVGCESRGKCIHAQVFDSGYGCCADGCRHIGIHRRRIAAGDARHVAECTFGSDDRSDHSFRVPAGQRASAAAG